MILRLGLQFAATIVLARLLSPEDFGIFAILAVLTSFAVVFMQGGLTIAIIQRRETTALQESAIFWWNLAGSLALAVIFAVGAVPFARFFNQPVLRPLVAVAGLHIVLSAAGAVHSALLTRSLRFDIVTKAGVASTVIAGITAIAAAFLGVGVWALAVQLVLQTLINTLALWWLSPWRPCWHWRLGTIRGMFRFGAWVSIGNVLDVLYTNGISLLIGKLFGMRELGFYNRAVVTQAMPGSILTAMVSRVALPLLAERQDDPAALRDGVRTATTVTMMINVPIMVGMALLSREITVVLFGQRWLPTAPILAVLAISGILLPMHVINLQAILATARSDTFIRIELAKKVCGLAFIVIGSQWGVVGLAWSQVALSIVALLINAGPAGRGMNYGPLRQLRDLWAIGLAAAVMTLAVLAVRTALPGGAIATLALSIVVGAASYTGAGWLTGAVVFRQMSALALDGGARLRRRRRQ